jgi:PST family polysaccharide transporter
MGFVMFIFAFAISGAAREIVLVILGKQWLEAIPILRILSLSIPFSLINSINGILFEANAWLNIKIILIILRLIVLGGLLFIGLNYGLIGVSIVILIISILYYIGFLYFSSERLKESFLELFQLNTSIITAGTISFILTFASSFILNKLNLSSIFILAFQGCIGAALLFIFFFLTPSRSIVIFFNQYLNNDDALPSIFVIDLFKKRYNILHKNIK